MVTSNIRIFAELTSMIYVRHNFGATLYCIVVSLSVDKLDLHKQQQLLLLLWEHCTI